MKTFSSWYIPKVKHPEITKSRIPGINISIRQIYQKLKEINLKFSKITLKDYLYIRSFDFVRYLTT